MSHHESYSDNYNKIRSSRGGLIEGTPIFMGKKTNYEIGEHYSPVQALLLGLLGREPSAQEKAILNSVVCLNIYPDIRIWTMRTGAFCAANKSSFSASYSASLMAFHSRIYGVQPIMDCTGMLQKAVRENQKAEEVIKTFAESNQILPGYGRPIISGPDERVIRLKEILEKEKWNPGKHFDLLFEIEEILMKEKGLYLNYAGIIAAVFSDLPFSLPPAKINMIAVEIAHLPLMFAINDIEENYDKRVPLLPLKVNDVQYTGKKRR